MESWGWRVQRISSVIRMWLAAPIRNRDFRQIFLAALVAVLLVLGWAARISDIGVSGALIAGVVYYLIPSAIWYVGVRLLDPTVRAFRFMLAMERLPFVPKRSSYRLLLAREQSVGDAIRQLLSRAIQLLLSILGAAALGTSYLIKTIVGQGAGSPVEKLDVFVGFMVLTSTILFLVFVPAWTYEDAGLRVVNRSHLTVFSPFETPRRLAVFGGFVTLAKFSLDLAGSPLAALAFLEAATAISIPLVMLLVGLFYNILRPRTSFNPLGAGIKIEQAPDFFK